MTESRWDEIHIRKDLITHGDRIHQATDWEEAPGYVPVENGGAGQDTEYHVELMRWARWVQTEAAQLVEAAVIEARTAGVPWSVIGEVHGSSKQAAQQRFGHLENASGGGC